MTEPYTYPGNELSLFENAKKYISSRLSPYIKGKVLEVGAGIGANTVLLNNDHASEWLLLEPDEDMTFELTAKIQNNLLPPKCEVMNMTISQLSKELRFDTIIYIDVLEHIESDKSELETASSLLNKGGHLIVLSPAFQSLYSPFDKAIGHYRRYSLTELKQLTPPSVKIIQLRYLDSVGYFASLFNKLFLRQSYPTLKQVSFWDKWMIPVSRFTDKIFFHSFGKSIVAVWKK
jgi:hypothetical protein